jgi:xanthine dehydrogenase YagS FAD-binding subunit
VDASTIDEAIDVLRQFGTKAKLIAGGTDLLGQLKNRSRPDYPEVLVNLKTLTTLDYIREDEEGLKIGPLTRLRDIAAHSGIKKNYTALAQAAHAVASPQIRIMGTIGGNLCQDCRCWYYRASKNYFDCVRKSPNRSETICYAIAGDNRYHSIFGAIKRCFAVHPSDTATSLVVLNAQVKTTKRAIPLEEFFAVRPQGTTSLESDEILTEIRVPRPHAETGSNFLKYALRKSIDFPIVNCSSAITRQAGQVKEARICLNGVYNLPYRATKAERYVEGKSITESIAHEASERTLEDAKPLRHNKYMVQIAKLLVERTFLSHAALSDAG